MLMGFGMGKIQLHFKWKNVFHVFLDVGPLHLVCVWSLPIGPKAKTKEPPEFIKYIFRSKNPFLFKKNVQNPILEVQFCFRANRLSQPRGGPGPEVNSLVKPTTAPIFYPSRLWKAKGYII